MNNTINKYNELKNRLLANPYKTMREEEDDVVKLYLMATNGLGKTMYMDAFENLEKNYPNLMDKIKKYAHHRENGRLETTKSNIKKKKYLNKNFSKCEKAVISAFTMTLRKQIPNLFVDTHVSFYANPENEATKDMCRGETDLYMEVEGQKYAVLFDSSFHDKEKKAVDDSLRSQIFTDAGCKVVRVREEGLPSIMDGNYDVIQLHRKMSGREAIEGQKEAYFKLVNHFQKLPGFENLKANLECMELATKDCNAGYEFFSSKEFYESIPNETKNKVQEIAKTLKKYKRKKYPELRNSLKKSAKDMHLSYNVRHAFCLYEPETFEVLKSVFAPGNNM